MNSLMKYVIFVCLFACLLGIYGCDSEDNPKPEEQITLSLSANKNTIKSNGKDTITFSVTANGKDVTSTAKISYRNSAGTTVVPDSTFTTTIAGTYKFFASYGDTISPEITINATELVLAISSDTTSIKANDQSSATLKVTLDGEDITPVAEIHHIFGETDSTLVDSVFKTLSIGEHKFYGIYKNRTSDTIFIAAKPVSLSIAADTDSIKANGVEKVTFTVSESDEIVTGAHIYIITGDNTEALEDSVFTTTEGGVYRFYATYKSFVSDTISINAKETIISITADRTAITTGGTIIFTATEDEDEDISSQITLNITKDGNTTTVEGNSFTPEIFGTYSITAAYDGRTSNAITVTVIPANVTISVDKTSIKANGKDAATFSITADQQSVTDAEIYVKGSPDTKLPSYSFSAETHGSYSFYAVYNGVISNETSINVTALKFAKQSCAMEIVATWCGYSPQMIEVFEEIYNDRQNNNIQIISFHRNYPSSSDLESKYVNGEGLLSYFGRTGIPYGKMDLSTTLQRKTASLISAADALKTSNPATAGIAIESKKDGNSLNVTLKVKSTETAEYSICAIVVQDSIVNRQKYYPNNDTSQGYYDNSFVHDAVALYTIPANTQVYEGKSLGTIEAGHEASEEFTITVGDHIERSAASTGSQVTIDYTKCRIVAYVMKKSGSSMIINNVTTCPINGSIGYLYE